MTTLNATANTRANLTRLDLAISRALECCCYGYEYDIDAGLTRIGDDQWYPLMNTGIWAGREVIRHFEAYYNDCMWHSRYEQQQIAIACERIRHAISCLESY